MRVLGRRLWPRQCHGKKLDPGNDESGTALDSLALRSEKNWRGVFPAPISLPVLSGCGSGTTATAIPQAEHDQRTAQEG